MRVFFNNVGLDCSVGCWSGSWLQLNEAYLWCSSWNYTHLQYSELFSVYSLYTRLAKKCVYYRLYQKYQLVW